MPGTQHRIDLNKEVVEIAEKAIEAFGLSYDKTAHSNLLDPFSDGAISYCDIYHQQRDLFISQIAFP